MRAIIESLPGHEGFVAVRLPGGRMVPAEGQVGRFDEFVAACGCGWVDDRSFPATEEGRRAVEEEWWRAHALPTLTVEPPGWLLTKSDVLREQIEILLVKQPQAALTLLSEVDGWRRALTDRAVSSAREQGLSWTVIGAALGITRQAAHERFTHS